MQHVAGLQQAVVAAAAGAQQLVQVELDHAAVVAQQAHPAQAACAGGAHAAGDRAGDGAQRRQHLVAGLVDETGDVHRHRAGVGDGGAELVVLEHRVQALAQQHWQLQQAAPGHQHRAHPRQGDAPGAVDAQRPLAFQAAPHADAEFVALLQHVVGWHAPCRRIRRRWRARFGAQAQHRFAAVGLGGQLLEGAELPFGWGCRLALRCGGGWRVGIGLPLCLRRLALGGAGGCACFGHTRRRQAGDGRHLGQVAGLRQTLCGGQTGQRGHQQAHGPCSPPERAQSNVQHRRGYRWLVWRGCVNRPRSPAMAGVPVLARRPALSCPAAGTVWCAPGHATSGTGRLCSL